jgi:hypothetical protein
VQCKHGSVSVQGKMAVYQCKVNIPVCQCKVNMGAV